MQDEISQRKHSLPRVTSQSYLWLGLCKPVAHNTSAKCIRPSLMCINSTAAQLKGRNQPPSEINEIYFSAKAVSIKSHSSVYKMFLIPKGECFRLRSHPEFHKRLVNVSSVRQRDISARRVKRDGLCQKLRTRWRHLVEKILFPH